MHHSKDLSDEWFKQLAGEARAERNGPAGKETRWTPLRKRIEAWDCAVYVVWLETHLDLARKPATFWDALENVVQPATRDLFQAEEHPLPAALPVVVATAKASRLPASGSISLSNWKR